MQLRCLQCKEDCAVKIISDFKELMQLLIDMVYRQTNHFVK